MTKAPVESNRGRNAIPTDKYIQQSQDKIADWEKILTEMKEAKELMGTLGPQSTKKEDIKKEAEVEDEGER